MTKTFSGYLEKDEVRAIIHKMEDVSRHPYRDSLLLELLWQTGCRIGEAVQLVPERVGYSSIILHNLKQRKVKKVDGKTVRDDKGKIVREPDTSATKEVEVTSQLCDAIKQYCSDNSITKGMWVFSGNLNSSKHMTNWYAWWIITKASEAAGVFRFGKKNPHTGGRFKGAYPHLFRHSNAMELLETTGDISLVKEQLGHSSIESTQVYAYAKKPKIKKAVKEIDWYGEKS